VLLGTGVLMHFTQVAPLAWRTGATFVHDWFALGLGLLVFGHIGFAIKDPEARRGMRTGRVSATWARAEHAAWATEAEHQAKIRAGQDPDHTETTAGKPTSDSSE